MREFGKLHTTFWTSPTIRGMSEDARTLAFYLLTSPHSNMIGCYRIPDGYAAEDLNWGSERVSKGFTELSKVGFLVRSEATKWVFITNYLKFNPIENPNQGKAAERLFEQLPEDEHKPLVFKALLLFSDKLSKQFVNGYETVAEPFRNKEKEKEKEKEKDKEKEKEKEKESLGHSPTAPQPAALGEVEILDERSNDQPSKRRQPLKQPTLEQVKEFARERGSRVDPEKFWNYYEMNGWTQGPKRKPIVNWQAAFRLWERTEQKPQGQFKSASERKEEEHLRIAEGFLGGNSNE